MMAGPLVGFKVVDVSAVVSGPLATMMLADLGAEVIKVEPAGLGDITRLPFNQRAAMTGLYANCNRGKRSMIVDVREPEGRQIILDLIADADVFVQNWRPGAADRLGLGDADLRAVNEGLIYASVSGYGETGPYADQRVYDPVIQAYTGMIAAQQQPDSGSYDLVRNIVADKVSSYTLNQAITAALLARERGAGGQYLHVPMLDATLAFFWPDGMMHKTLIGDGVEVPICLSDLYRVYKTSDSHVISFFQSPSELTGLANALERSDGLDDPNLLDVAEHLKDFQGFVDRVQNEVSKFTTAQIVERFVEQEVPVAPVLDHDEVLVDPQVQHNGSVVEFDHPIYGTYRQAKQPVQFSVTTTEPALQPALHGEHTTEVLGELGYAGADIQSLRDKGVIG
jgi:crotonobetainyl-CoA:carnitine CoA-transferase CaiB-like acyl-CoA transferase